MKNLSLIALAIVLTGCTPAPRVTKVTFLERVLTVDEYLAQRPLLEKVTAFCMNNPGENSLDPNCINAQQAQHIANLGSGNFPKLKF